MASSWRWPCETLAPRSPSASSRAPRGSAATKAAACAVSTARARSAARDRAVDAELEVLLDRAGEEQGVLENDPDVPAEARHIPLAHVPRRPPAPGRAALVRAIEETRAIVRFALAGRPDQRHALARRTLSEQSRSTHASSS